MYIKCKAQILEEPMAVMTSDFNIPDSEYTETIVITEIITSWTKGFNKVTASVRTVKAAPPNANDLKLYICLLIYLKQYKQM